MSRDDYRQMLDYYHEPCKFSTTSTVHHDPPLFDPPLGPFQYNSVQHVPSMPYFTRPTKEKQSEILENKMAIGNTSNGGASYSAFRDPKEPSHDDYNAKNADTSARVGSIQFDNTNSQIDSYQVENHGAIEHLQTLLENEASSHDHIYEAYSQLPSPGVKYLSAHNRRLLLRRLSVVETKTKQSMLRYLTLVDHMKEASIALDEAEWNSAIAYAGRCFVRVEASEVESALRIWKEMEQEAGVKSGKVTFNILFDIVIRAGKYVLAEMILDEMRTRGLEYNRFSYVGMIFYYGIKGDGAAVRKAYRDLVEAGQIVDTVVMNCVIASLLRAGELPAAEQVYERMKRSVFRMTGQFVPNSDWRASRELGRALDKASRIMRNDEKGLQLLQAEQCLAPDLRTFYIFIDHHIHVTGELRRVTALLEDMQVLKTPMHGRIYLKIFRGFAYHGGVRYTSWTQQRLEAVWTSLLSILDEEIDGVHMMKWLVIWIIRAFAQCCGRTRALQIWEEVRDRWKIAGEDEKGAVEHLLRNLLEDKTNNDSRR